MGLYSDIDSPQQPGLSEDEKSVISEQTALTRNATRERTALQPFIFEKMNLDPTGQRKLTEPELFANMTPTELKLNDIQKSLYGNLKNAYTGGIASQGLEKDLIGTQRGLLGIGGTSGIQESADFGKRANILRDLARRRVIGGTENYLNTGSLISNLKQNDIAKYQAFPQRNLDVIKNYASVLEPYKNERDMIFGRNVAESQRKQAEQSGNQQAAGTTVAVIAALAIAI